MYDSSGSSAAICRGLLNYLYLTENPLRGKKIADQHQNLIDLSWTMQHPSKNFTKIRTLLLEIYCSQKLLHTDGQRELREQHTHTRTHIHTTAVHNQLS